MIKHVLAELAPDPRAPRRARAAPEIVDDVLADGNARARAVAAQTMGEVREAMKI